MSSAAASSVSDYNNLTGPAVQALLDAAGPLGPEVGPYNCRTSTGQIPLSDHTVLFLQILKASEIGQKAVQVSAASHSSPHAGHAMCLPVSCTTLTVRCLVQAQEGVVSAIAQCQVQVQTVSSSYGFLQQCLCIERIRTCYCLSCALQLFDTHHANALSYGSK